MQPNKQKIVVVVPQETEERLIQTLVDYGCPRPKTEREAQAALSAGFYPSWIEYNVGRWWAYAHSSQGEGIRTPATFVLSKVRYGDPCPNDFVVSPYNPDYKRLGDLKAAWDAEQIADQSKNDCRQANLVTGDTISLKDTLTSDQNNPPIHPESVSLPISGCHLMTDQVWWTALSQLQMTRATFDTWVRQTYVMSYEDGIFTIGVHNSYAKDWLENRLRSLITRTLADVTGHTIQVRFEVYPAAVE